jgi:hypothetical protein
VPTVPAPVVAQSWRGTSRQAQLARFLTGCFVESLDDDRARSASALAAQAAATDVVDARVVDGALRRGDLVVGSDHDDLLRIAAAVGRGLEIDHP